MPFSNYVAPGVNVTFERQSAIETAVTTTQFYPVFLGTGMPSVLEQTFSKDLGTLTDKEDDFQFTLADVTYLVGSQARISKVRAKIGTSSEYLDITSRIRTFVSADSLDISGVGTLGFSLDSSNPSLLTTALSDAITTSSTFITVDDVTKLYLEQSSPSNPYQAGKTSNNQFLKIVNGSDEEIVRVESIVGNNINVERGTSTKAFASGSVVTGLTTLRTSASMTITSGAQYSEITFVLQQGTVRNRIKVGQKFTLSTSDLSEKETVYVSKVNNLTDTVTLLRVDTAQIDLTSSSQLFLYTDNPNQDLALSSTKDFKITAEVTKSTATFEPVLVLLDDKFDSTSIFGPFTLTEKAENSAGNLEDVVVRNDIAIAAEIAFRSGVEAFYFLAAPRRYGQKASAQEIINSFEKLYFKPSAYRIVPLISHSDVTHALSEFVSDISDQYNKREVVGFVSNDLSNTLDNEVSSIEYLIEEVGQYASLIDNKRICLVFGGKTVTMNLNNVSMVLPEYFLNVAVASADAALPVASPLTLRQVLVGTTTNDVFTTVHSPKFRNADWDRLAKYGVMILSHNTSNEPLSIRHQLTTSQTNVQENYEYSLVKNLDAITKLLRDRLGFYVGRETLNQTLFEKLDASLTLAIDEARIQNLCNEITVESRWSAITKLDEDGNSKTTLAIRLRITPNYPANNLDIILVL